MNWPLWPDYIKRQQVTVTQINRERTAINNKAVFHIRPPLFAYGASDEIEMPLCGIDVSKGFAALQAVEQCPAADGEGFGRFPVLLNDGCATL